MKKILALGAAVALAIVMVVSGSFAWFQARDSVKNHLEVPQFNYKTVTVVEVFSPPEIWQPGKPVTKQAAVVNGGTVDVFARVHFQEVLSTLMPAVGVPTRLTDRDMRVRPKYFNPKGYLSDPEWKEAKDVFSGKVEGLPAGVTLRVKAVTDEQGKTSYLFAIWSDLSYLPKYEGKAQRVTADFTVTGNDLSVSNVKFWQATLTKDSIRAFPSYKPSAENIVHSLVDKGSPKRIGFEYADLAALQAATPQANKWWYNPADGYFYFMGKLAAGEMTPLLLSALLLDEGAGSEYMEMVYDLMLILDVVQAVKEQLTAGDASWGWNLPTNSPVLAMLQPLCK
ncbi:MAG: BsaA family SipW-dependent biofilm matrix protein [Propionibacteriaceae bacterium]|jgi:hypothetical protein|nr:BsaA family SipW-dependent biofilm matrix protein [Propionibacteriaceae bacterium]